MTNHQGPTRLYWLVAIGMLCLGTGWIAAANIPLWNTSARNIDAQWLFAAAECLSQGKSPYIPPLFYDCWAQRGNWGPPDSFVLPPATMIFTLPLTTLHGTSQHIFITGLNFASWLLLSFCLLRIVHFITGATDWRAFVAIGWVFLGVTNTGVFSAILTGQTSLFTAAGLAGLCLTTLVPQARGVSWSSVLALFKPHLVLAPLLFAWAHKLRSSRKSLIHAVLAVAIMNAWIFILDPLFVPHVVSGFQEHFTGAIAGMHDPAALYGVRSLVAIAEPGPSIGIAVGALLLLGMMQFILRRSDLGNRNVLICATLAAAIMLGVFLIPHKQYDFAIYAPVFAAVVALPSRLQLLQAPLLACIWRPSILHQVIPMNGDTHRLVMDLVLLLSGTLFAAIAIAAFRQTLHRQQQPAPAG